MTQYLTYSTEVAYVTVPICNDRVVSPVINEFRILAIQNGESSVIMSSSGGTTQLGTKL